MPAPATLAGAAGFPPAVVHATQAGSVTASVTRAAGVTAAVTSTACAITSVT